MVAAALLGGVAVATAAPGDVVADYNADGVIDERHPPADLLAALQEALESEPQYGAFADAVGVALDESLLGVETGGVQPFAPQLVGGERVRPLSPLPTPRPPGDGPPWLLVGMAGLAALLLCAGAASAVYRQLAGDRDRL